MACAPTLQTLRAALYQVSMQAEAIKVQERSGSTYDLADEVSREAERLSESVRDEIATLERWAVLLDGGAA